MKVLILTGKFGMGHYSVAEALKQKMLQESENAEIAIEDIFHLAFHNRCESLYKWFSFLVRRGIKVYNLVYRNPEDRKRAQRFPFRALFRKRVKERIEGMQTEIVISTLPFCAQLAAEYKRGAQKPIRLITCITDVTSHSEWIYPETDLYLVASASVKQALTEKGVPPWKILVSGIPVRQQFKPRHRKTDVRQKRLLVMGGGLGLLPAQPVFYERLSKLPDVKIIIIAGGNQAIQESLSGKYENIEVRGYVEDVYRYMQAADMIISKPGGITLFEAISVEIPLLAFAPFLQQEVKNGMFIQENKLGIVFPGKAEGCISQIEAILKNDGLLEEMRENMRRFKRSLHSDALLAYLGGEMPQGEVCA